MKKGRRTPRRRSRLQYEKSFRSVPLPEDLETLGNCFGRVLQVCAMCHGLLPLLAALKLPSARVGFLDGLRSRWKERSNKSHAVFCALQDMVRKLDALDFRDERTRIGNPWYAVGYVKFLNKLHVIAAVPARDKKKYRPSDLFNLRSKEKFRLLQFSRKAEVAISTFLDKNLHNSLKAIFSGPPLKTLDAYNAAHEHLKTAMVNAGCVGMSARGTWKYVNPWIIRTLLVAFNLFYGVERVSFKDSATLRELPGPDKDNHRKQLEDVCKSNRISVVVEKVKYLYDIVLLLCYTCLSNRPSWRKQVTSAGVASRASGHQPGKRKLELADTKCLKRRKTIDGSERASQEKPGAIVERREALSVVKGCLKKERNGSYRYQIQGKFATRGPTRKTEMEAQRDADAVRKAKSCEAAQKILKDLRAKVLRAEGKKERTAVGYLQVNRNSYQYTIQGKWTARGPVRKTKKEANRDRDAVRRRRADMKPRRY